MAGKKMSLLLLTLVVAMVLVASFVPLAFARELSSDGVTTRRNPLINIMLAGGVEEQEMEQVVVTVVVYGYGLELCMVETVHSCVNLVDSGG
ncbi:hypothetical protein F0562_015112 [Nyssa sinensis]|uniref:Uncharacterized protein n=1 Tax=Nyssa sinensis TaxID=561372 RepID=A0A5J4ZJA5_9ASTE|nr:hypothetical protein F0562_015112 [Nyssa sinensis]